MFPIWTFRPDSLLMFWPVMNRNRISVLNQFNMMNPIYFIRLENKNYKHDLKSNPN